MPLPGHRRRNIPEAIGRQRAHREWNNCRLRLEGITDNYLENLCAASTCLIATSFKEAFGLPFIETARHKLPINCRDISVFCGVAGDYAHYFQGKTPRELAVSIKPCLGLSASGQAPTAPEGMTWLMWKQSTEQLIRFI